ncbi:hypothetical protein ABXK36_35095, partial [Bacillus cereus]|uniref:hypothetical protein n=1 Tax=Bacillus cereus TaxID=1396 RepID=UPI0036021CA5
INIEKINAEIKLVYKSSSVGNINCITKSNNDFKTKTQSNNIQNIKQLSKFDLLLQQNFITLLFNHVTVL